MKLSFDNWTSQEKTELSLAGSLRSAGSMATSAGSAIIQKVAEKARALSGSPAQQHQQEFILTHDYNLPKHSFT